jgi:hypothetical protein
LDESEACGVFPTWPDADPVSAAVPPSEDEATCQVSAFFSGLGLGTTLSLPITASVGEAFVQFEYVEAEQAMAVLAVIYRFQTEPRAFLTGKACRRRQRALPVGSGLRGAADIGRATGPAV